MKRILFSLIITVACLSGSAQTWTAITSTTPDAGKVQLVSSSIERSLVSFKLPGFYLNEVVTPQGTAFSIKVEQATPILEAGAPDLPKMTVSLVIPDQAGMDFRVVSSTYKDYPGLFIAPSKGNLMRDIDPSTVPYTFGAAYSIDNFYPGMLGTTREPYIVRDVRGQTLITYPFQYNPVTKVLRVYYDLTIELYSTGGTGINPLQQSAAKKISQDFLPVFTHQFSNFDAMTYTPLEEYGNLLVISYGAFMNAMQPYVEWKRAEGYQTEMVDKATIGTTAAQIKTYIANYYNTKGLTHVLLVGDVAQIPTNTGGNLGGPSHNAYGYVVGNDHYSDIFIGRFSAETEAQVQTQVQRTLEYEQSPQFVADSSWFTTVIGIGSDQGPGDDNEYDYQHIRNQQTLLLDKTYTVNKELFDGSQGGHDAPGNPTPPMVAIDVNNGASLILYTGHGSNTSWGTTGFSNSNVNQLTNAGKLPFVWSVACVNGNFSAGTCFAEAWLRATHDGQPTGAIAFLGSTINQSWNSPMEGQDEMTNILVEANPNNIKRTFAGLSINGCMKMIDSYGTDGANMADTWMIFGDPSIMVRTAVPLPITADFDTLLFVGDSVLPVYCGTNAARVTATLADSILATGQVVNDTVLLSFPALTVAFDTIHLVITAYNMLPYTKDLVVRAIPAALVPGFTAEPTRVVPGNTVAFSDTTAGSPIIWRWSFPGGTPSVSTEQNPVVTYDSLGTFDVKLIVNNGFASDSIVRTGYIVVDWPAFTKDKTGSFQCTVLPNPGNGNFKLNLRSLQPDVLNLSVFDLVGALVYSAESFAVSGQVSKFIDLTSLPEGLYFLKLAGKQTMSTQKLIISR